MLPLCRFISRYKDFLIVFESLLDHTFSNCCFIIFINLCYFIDSFFRTRFIIIYQLTRRFNLLQLFILLLTCFPGHRRRITSLISLQHNDMLFLEHQYRARVRFLWLVIIKLIQLQLIQTFTFRFLLLLLISCCLLSVALTTVVAGYCNVHFHFLITDVWVLRRSVGCLGIFISDFAYIVDH